MSDTLAPWLALREPADAVARSAELARAVANAVRDSVAPAATLTTAAPPPDSNLAGVTDTQTVRVLDLATGAGSNLRYLAEYIQGRQHWLVVDRSAVLLAQLMSRTSSWARARDYDVRGNERGLLVRSPRFECEIETRLVDLRALDDPKLFEGRHMVTASALLDLVSETWLRALAAHCRRVGAAASFTITYNGRSTCSPTDPEDDLILDLFNQHQRSDKGLGGTAAGPDAGADAVRCFAQAGYHVESRASDWQLGQEQAELQRQLVDGWAAAASEVEPGAASTIAEWRARRLQHVDAGRSRIVVGHDDMAAWLPRG